jgi:hypothetical protein
MDSFFRFSRQTPGGRTVNFYRDVNGDRADLYTDTVQPTDAHVADVRAVIPADWTVFVASHNPNGWGVPTWTVNARPPRRGWQLDARRLPANA